MVDPDTRALEAQSKFEYGFATLTYAFLGLSFHFSPGMGRELDWLLVSSWGLLLMAALTGGWRLMEQPTFHRIAAFKLHLEGTVSQRKQLLGDPRFATFLEAHSLLDAETRSNVSEETIRDHLSNEELLLQVASENQDRIAKRTPLLFKFQMATFLAGLLAHAIFASANYLHSSGTTP